MEPIFLRCGTDHPISRRCGTEHPISRRCGTEQAIPSFVMREPIASDVMWEPRFPPTLQPSSIGPPSGPPKAHPSRVTYRPWIPFPPGSPTSLRPAEPRTQPHRSNEPSAFRNSKAQLRGAIRNTEQTYVGIRGVVSDSLFSGVLYLLMCLVTV